MEGISLVRLASDYPIPDTEPHLSRPEGKKGRNSTNTPWTDELIKRLVQLFEQDLSASQIGAELGMTRNAIIGKLHRLELSKPRPVKAPTIKPPRKSSRPDGVVIRFRAPRIVPIAAAEVVPLHIDMMDLRNDHCRERYGDSYPYTFCGHTTQTGSSFCPSHHAINFIPRGQR